MAIKTIPMNSNRLGKSSSEENDCIVLKVNKTSFDSGVIELSFPFHEDTPNFFLTLREAMELRNAIDQLYDIKLLEHSGGNK